MNDLLMRVNGALTQGDWNSVVVLGSELYGIACACGDRVSAEMWRDVTAMALLVVEHPGLGYVSSSLVLAMRERLRYGGLAYV